MNSIRQLARSNPQLLRMVARQSTSAASGSPAAAAQKAAGAAKDISAKTMGYARCIAQRLAPITSRVGLSKVAEPTVYWSKVMGEIAKQVYLKEKFQPPRFADLEAVVTHAYMCFSTGAIFQVIKFPSMQQMVMGAVYATQIYGFYAVGKMVGRWSITHYKVE